MITVYNSPFVYDWRVLSIDQQLTTVSPTMFDSIKGSSLSRSNTPTWKTEKNRVLLEAFIIWEKGNCLHLSLVFYKVIDIIRHNYIHIFKGLQIKRHFCHQFWILRIKDTYILDNVKKAYVSHKIMIFG